MALSKARKEELLAQYQEELAQAEALIWGHNRGMGVVDAESLRQNLREVGAKAMVVKNTLLRLALEEQGSPWDPDMMQGANLVTFASGDLGQATKAVVEFARTHERVFAIKGGMISGTIIDGDGVKALSELPSREQLLAQVVGGVQAPLTGLVGVLSGVMRGLVTVLHGRQEQLEGSAG
ncbi:MAG: 50S ribosomal protein L10 [Anaerolineae bacterium]